MNVATVISSLQNLSTAELAAEYEGVFGKKPRSRSPVWMRKRIAHRLQESAYGGLSGLARDEIERLTGERSTKWLNSGQAWEFIDALCVRLNRSNRIPICVHWCPGYVRGSATLHGGNVASLPSQAQAWHLHRTFRESGVKDIKAFLASDIKFKLPDGVIRTAEQAWWVSKAARNMAGWGTSARVRKARTGAAREAG